MKNNYIKILLIVILVFIFGTVNVNAKTVCKRAKTLHTELCRNLELYDTFNAGCLEKYNDGDTITYGQLGTKDILAAGDAFDCDVNGDGIYDSNTERFYYVTDLDANTKWGVLIYYRNLINEEDDDYMRYDESNKPRENGPISLAKFLPTIAQWKNVSLYNTTRKITDENGVGYLDFSYSGYAARFLTIHEARKTCGINNPDTDELNLFDCQHLLENTTFHEESYWDWYFLEGIKSGADTSKVQTFIPAQNYMHAWASVDAVSSRKGRPVIEVNKSEIEDSGYKEDDPSTDPTQEVSVPDTAASVSKIILVNAIICILIGITIISLNTIHKRKRN